MDAFNFPAAPDTRFPGVHVWVDLAIWTIAILCAVHCLRDWRRTGSPLGLVLLLGGALAYLNEPVDDVLGLVHHPRAGQNIVLDTIGPVPMWGLPTYIIFFGFVPLVVLREIERKGFSPRVFWAGVLSTFVLDLLLELPVLYVDGGLYQYYGPGGEAPLTLFRFPVYWLFINTTGPIMCAAVVLTFRDHFRGWRAPFLVALPLMTDAACSIVVGLPVYSGLHVPDAPGAVPLLAAAATCVVGIFVLDALATWLAAADRHRRRELAGWVERRPDLAPEPHRGVTPSPT
ncbi:MAG TPA: hypothetical protein VNS55_09575 [Nocardioides sp.]|nr:hypothetical protein [Nocardioides sp.]